MSSKAEKIAKYKQTRKEVNFDRWFGGNKYAELNLLSSCIKEEDTKKSRENRT
jgi:hypothetical protein